MTARQFSPPFEVHYHPPKYPPCFPGRCEHAPQFQMSAAVKIVHLRRGQNEVEIDHLVCLACGLPRPCTIGGNVLVDLTMLLDSEPARASWQIGMRVVELRDKWSRIATHLFDKKGWNGRHERIARLIDPNLTMKIRLDRRRGTSLKTGRFKFDPGYLRWAEEAA